MAVGYQTSKAFIEKEKENKLKHMTDKRKQYNENDELSNKMENIVCN